MFGIGVSLGMMVLGGLVLLDARQDAWRQAEQASQNLLLALERDIARNITVFDLSLQGVFRAMAAPGLDDADPGVRHHALFDTSATAEDLGSIVILNATGAIEENSLNRSYPNVDLSDRDYFRVHRDRADVGLYLSRPFMSRLGGDLSIAVSRRRPTADGHFAGVVAGTLKLTFFRRLLEKLNVGPHGSIILFRTDGRLVMRYPYRDQDVDRDFSASSTYRRFAASGEGSFVNRAAFDGVQRLYVYRTISGLPLILSVNTAIEDIYAAWKRKAILIGGILAILCAAVVVSTLLFRREMKRRAMAERTLRDLTQELAVAAATDSLTGIPNRRAFEAELDRLWAQDARERGPVALLMVDIDHFKSYNDHYGHQAGDAVLKSVARCLRDNLRGPDDMVARCGGEEFVVILPGTDAASAINVAERLRGAVVALAIDHVSSPGRVTISLGGSVALSRRACDWNALLAAADAALYEAKRHGRNRVRLALNGDEREVA